MRAVYVTRSFLDYRIPVLEALRRKLGDGLRFIYSADYVPERCDRRVRSALGAAAVGLTGEWRIGPNETAGFANRQLRIVHQPGLWSAIAEAKPDVVVGDGFFQWTSVALAYRMRHRVGLVVCYERTFHTERAAQRVRTAYRRQVVRWVDSMACNGRLSREYSVHLGMPAGRITVGQMAADSHRLARLSDSVGATQREHLRTQWGSPRLVFVTVGRLNARKGIAELLNGWARLESRCPGDWRLVVIGDGPDRMALEQKSRALGLRGVVFQGHVDYDGIAAMYGAVDVLVMPTREDNWSLVVPEAMACGLPVLCSVYNGCHPELISEGVNGWTFDPLDPDSTYQGLRRCLDAASRLAEMGQASREIAGVFTPERAADSIIEACGIALARSRPRRSRVQG
jgi:glycosyltransferase involved in cell wall biosynthesis